VELLAPAGGFASLMAGINAGADGVYFGIKEAPNMRANAKNFRMSDLKKIRRICGDNIKLYLTLNTLVYDEEIKKIEKIIIKSKPFIDAIICFDNAIIMLCRKHNVKFHISTQANVSNVKSAEFYKNLGAERIVLARELNKEQIKRIAKVIDVEVFCHGAMCVSVSGRCFISQFLFNKSANRGECLQPCRRAYSIKDEEGNELKLENNTVMSAKDLCTLPFIEELKKLGVRAFKIEGRNREPEYVDKVVRIYRRALDSHLTNEELSFGLEELNKVYNKGFSSGFFIAKPSWLDFSREENSSSSEKKEFIGKIIHYFKNIGVAVLKLNSGFLKKGEEIVVIGERTGVIRSIVDSMEISGNKRDYVNKGQEIGIKLEGVRKGDSVYKILKKS
jgi:putative protease